MLSHGADGGNMTAKGVCSFLSFNIPQCAGVIARRSGLHVNPFTKVISILIKEWSESETNARRPYSMTRPHESPPIHALTRLLTCIIEISLH